MQSSHAIVTPSFLTLLSDIVDAKARTEYERDRQKAHKGQDVRKKFNGKSSSGTTTPRRTGLGHGSAWRNSVIALEDMEDPRDLCDPIMMDDEDTGKENSRPIVPHRPLSISLEDLVVRPAAAAAQNKKPRKSVSRSSLSRQASSDNLAAAFPTLSLTSPPSASLSIISESDFDPSLTPMQSPASSDCDDFDDDEYEFSSPGADDWTMDEIEDGCFRFVSSSSTSVVVEKCVW